MSASSQTKRRRQVAALAASCCALAVTTATYAQTAEGQPSAPAGIPIGPTPNVTINLIRLMVEQKLLPAEAAAKLIAQAEAEAAQASAALTAAAAKPAAPAPAAAEADGTVHVTYIPPHVRRQMVEEIRSEVMSQAVNERWADPQALPEWATRWKFSGDMRLRYEGQSFADGNATGSNVNFNAINNGNGQLVLGTPTIPYYNADQDRQRERVRARLGAEVNLEEGFSSGLRIATGDSNSPVSQNQSLGGGTGNFSKYSLWLDRGYLRYETEVEHTQLKATGGRFNNPFFGSSMIWANDLAFDGFVLEAQRPVGEELRPFFTTGLFPVFNTDLNFATNQSSKFKSTDKWLYALQGGTNWKINKDFEAKVGLAYYHFQNIEGQFSSPTTGTTDDPGDTDATRPLFAQKGNTYTPIRNISASTSSSTQYFGLATPFHEVALTGRLDYNHFDPIQVSLLGEVVQNVGYKIDNASVVNNQNSSGDLGFFTAVQVGHATLETRGDWNVSLGYRYVETDAVVDGFCDSDFGGGGTNVKGFTLGGNLALSARVWFGTRLMSADQISGPTYKNDTVQFDINARF